ncbi:MAG: sugar-binding protein [Fibrella sp.]|nr:sugar-binding protein [Armatimonadota bacterium]
MNRSKFLLGLAVSAAFFLTGCPNNGANNADTSSTTGGGTTASTAPSGSGEKISVAFVTNNASDFWTIARKGTDKAVEEMPGVELQFVMPTEGAADQKSKVEDLLAKGVKAIAISPVDPKNQTAWLDTVAEKAVLITQDSDAPGSKRMCYIGTDNVAAGKQAGELIKKALPEGGKIMLFVGKRDAENARQREEGIRQALEGSKVTILDVRTDDADRARAKSNAADALTKYPDLAAEVGIWSYNGPAILSAVTDAGKTGKVKIICFDEEDATLAGIKSGAIYATVVQQPYQFGYQGVKMMVDIVKGDKSGVPESKQKIVETQGITKETVDEFKANLDKQRGK